MAAALRHGENNRFLMIAGAGVAVLLALLLAIGFATRIDPASRPVIEVLGGGFIYNYRIAEVKYGLTAVVRQPLESGSIIEARFEDPGGGPDLVVSQRVSPMTNQYTLESPPVRGVEAERPYAVTVRVLDRLGTRELFSQTQHYRSQIDDKVVPDAPLTIGPGYHRNPQR
jgi:hypothetical protein